MLGAQRGLWVDTEEERGKGPNDGAMKGFGASGWAGRRDAVGTGVRVRWWH